jgi:hypothetical protein
MKGDYMGDLCIHQKIILDQLRNQWFLHNDSAPKTRELFLSLTEP